MSLVHKVRVKISIHAHRRVRTLLEGEYNSVFKGRSLEFDDLREYVLGDDVKDIDWKATARSGDILIRRYIAVRKHHILLVVNTGRSMAALTSDLQSKADVAITTAGVIGYIAQKHGDLVALAAGDESGVHYRPLSARTTQLEHMLRFLQQQIKLSGPAGNLTALLDYIARNIKRRMILVIIDDTPRFNEQQIHLLKRLRVQHEIMYVSLQDFDPTAAQHAHTAIYDVQRPVAWPQFIRTNPQVAAAVRQASQQQHLHNQKTLQRLGISSVVIGREQQVVSQIITLLERHRHAK